MFLLYRLWVYYLAHPNEMQYQIGVDVISHYLKKKEYIRWELRDALFFLYFYHQLKSFVGITLVSPLLIRQSILVTAPLHETPSNQRYKGDKVWSREIFYKQSVNIARISFYVQGLNMLASSYLKIWHGHDNQTSNCIL
jgi:hypothetical protein